MSDTPFRIIIAGGRGFDDYELLRDTLRKLLTNKMPNVIVISGCAKGADKLGEVFAIYHELEIEKFPAQWDLHGRGAGYIRNRQMAGVADALVACWDGESRGTANMIETMKKMNKPFRIIKYN